MSFMDKVKEFFSGGSQDAHDRTEPAAQAPIGMDDPGPAATPMPPADPAGMPTGEPQPAEPQADEPRAGGHDA
jgi:hypothetical protein